MSRSGYSDDCDNVGLWRGAVQSAIAGKRGQKFLREMAAALDAMPVKELVANETVRDSAHVCAMGSVIVARGVETISLADINDLDAGDVGEKLGIAPAMAKEIAFLNDDDFGYTMETPAQRWARMRAWVASQIQADGAA